ncbi:NADP-dependent oxidoreductase [Streptantibioticus silvisoli]|uniref:NADP-dependent oxidoreductase n=1 Tax=Streptantibioticus silvisoli TaxID=2705255 RepID=A0ABT6VSH3_9ACTN|nr:NADP-dependent oxidoreductase [Streptantibioticus silvisoli]MDI5961120.1 NADP-dependent oxidoreductase [Streptantibioticus silvisoli]
MKALRFHEYGAPDVLRYEDTARPEPAPGEVLIEVAATSFNPVDAAIRAGLLRQVFPVALPHVPGIDVAGTVVRLGAGATGRVAGDQVVGFLPMLLDGAAAEFVTVPAALLAPAPTTIPLTEAAALPATALTAWQALFEHAGLRPGQRVLVNGAGGGVGGFAVQLAKGAGAFVIATAGPRSTEAVRADGADQLVDHTVTGPAEALTEPVDVVLNLVGAPEARMAELTALTRPGGVVVSTASPAVADPARGVRALGMQLRADADQLTSLAKKVDAGELHVRVTASHPLSQAALVHERSAAGLISGKVVLTPTD